MTTIVLQIYNWIKIIILQLWWSVSSVNFYQRVLSFYDGYGIKYVLTLSFFSSMFCSIYVLNYMGNVRQYLSYGIMSEAVANLDHIISQLPELSYDGDRISLEEGEPVYINNNDNLPIVIIDPDNKISSSVRAKAPILFTSKRLIISFVDTQKENVASIPVDYKQIFGNEPKLLTQEVQKASLEEIFNKAPKVLIYMIFPAFGMLIFFNLFLEKSILIIVIYLLTNFMSMALSIKTCTRLTMFSSGVFVLVQPLISFINPVYMSYVWLVQVWANFLMILAILRFSNKSFFVKTK